MNMEAAPAASGMATIGIPGSRTGGSVPGSDEVAEDSDNRARRAYWADHFGPSAGSPSPSRPVSSSVVGGGERSGSGWVVVVPATGPVYLRRVGAGRSGVIRAAVGSVRPECLSLSPPGLRLVEGLDLWTTPIDHAEQPGQQRPVGMNPRALALWLLTRGHPDRQLPDTVVFCPASQPPPGHGPDPDAVTGYPRLTASLLARVATTEGDVVLARLEGMQLQYESFWALGPFL